MSDRAPPPRRCLVMRLRELHWCQEGGGQSLAFVMTLPLFVGTVLLLVQLSQLLHGVVTVQYAAFAAARSAVVWIPSRSEGRAFVDENEVHVAVDRQGRPIDVTAELRLLSRKYREIHAAAAQACVAISPARSVGGPRAGASEVGQAVDAFLTVQQLSSDPRAGRWRIAAENRWSYAFANTRVRLAFLGQPRHSPTYNPIGHPVVDHHPAEVGWDEAITVVVQHEVSLVPGPGRRLFQGLAWGSTPQSLADQWTGSGRLDRVPVVGSCTLTLAGLKSNRPITYPASEE